MEENAKKISFSKEKKKIIIVTGSIMLVMITTFVMLFLFKRELIRDEFSNGYACITEGLDETKIEDEKDALKAINKVMHLVDLTDPENELKVVAVYTVGNDTYYKFQQYHEDVPIQGNALNLVVDNDGIATSIIANTEKYKKPGEETVRGEEEYINATLKHTKYDKILSKLVGDKEYIPDKNHNIVLSYPVKLDYLYKEQIYAKILYISSEDLSVLKEVNLGENNIILPNIEEAKKEDKEKTEDLLVDKERNILCGYISRSVDGAKYYISDKSDSDCLVAYENMQKIYDYFGNTLGIQSFDNAGRGIYLLLSQDGYLVDKTMSFLFESNEDKCDYGAIILGEPDKLCAERPVKAVDLIAYEYAQQMMKNIVLIENESMREAIGDIFGNLAELQITSEEASWQVGENSGYVKYDMSNSVTMKDYDKSDKGYKNASILAHTAYLMSNGIDGEENMKISPEKLTNLWYRAMFLLTSDATYSQCRNAVEVSADVMVANNELTSEERRCISAAFDEVLIGQAAYTNAKTMKNQFTLSVCGENSNEEVTYELTIYKIDTLEHTEKEISPKKVYKTTKHNGIVELQLEDGVYEVIIADTEDNNVANDVKKKLIVDGSSEEASDMIEVYVLFGKEEQEEKTEETSGQILNYERIVEQYIALIQRNYYRDYWEMGETYVSKLLGYYINSNLVNRAQVNENYKVFYSLVDINGDGVEEFLLGGKEKDIIHAFDIFTYDGKKPISLFAIGECGDKRNFKIYDTGIICKEDFAGNSHRISYYELDSKVSGIRKVDEILSVDEKYYEDYEAFNAKNEISKEMYSAVREKYSSDEIKPKWFEIVAKPMGNQQQHDLIEEAVLRYENYFTYSIVCDVQTNIDVPKEVKKAIKEEYIQQNFYWPLAEEGYDSKVTCCRNSDELGNHLTDYIGHELIFGMNNSVFEYNNTVYLPLGIDVSEKNYRNVTIIKDDGKNLSIIVGYYGKGATQKFIERFDMEKTEKGNYKVMKVQEHTSQHWP